MVDEKTTEERLQEQTKIFDELLKVCGFKVVDNHLECDCQTVEARDQMAKVLEKEVIIRVKPKVEIEPAAKVTEAK